jgi:Secretion system C-terminal sorting domain
MSLWALFLLCAFFAQAQTPAILRNITVSVDMTGQNVSAKGVHVAHDLGGNWKPNGTKMTAVGNGIYTATIPVPDGTKIRYKFNNGDSWDNNESVQSGCGERNIYGYYDRAITAKDLNYAAPLACFGACMPCGNRLPQSGYYYCPNDPNLIYCENFEALQHGKLVPQVPNWTTVDLVFGGSTVPAAGDIPSVTGFWNGYTNFDGSRALRLYYNDFSGHFDHPLMYMGYPNEGTFQLDFKMYLPKRNTGYIGFADTSRNGFTMLFKNDSLSFLSSINYTTFAPQRIGTPVAYRQDNWNDVSLVFNAATKRITVRVNNATVFSDINRGQKGFGFLEMGALDINELFPKTSEFFIDDLVYRRIPNQPQIQEVPNSLAQTASVSPNPAHEKIVISPDANTRDNWQIRLINTLGQVMITQQSSAATPIDITTNAYKSGMYIVEFQSASTRWTKKVMIQH